MSPITVRPTAQAIGTNELNTVGTSKNCIPSRACGLTIISLVYTFAYCNWLLQYSFPTVQIKIPA